MAVVRVVMMGVFFAVAATIICLVAVLLQRLLAESARVHPAADRAVP
jgi:hypothetical protein